MRRLFVLLFLFFSLTRNAAADDTALVHFAAHFGMSYAITTISYGIAEKGLGLKRTPSFIVGAITALAMGLAYKAVEPNGLGNESFPRAMGENAAGIAASGLTIALFHF